MDGKSTIAIIVGGPGKRLGLITNHIKPFLQCLMGMMLLGCSLVPSVMADSGTETWPDQLTFVYCVEPINPMSQWHIRIYKEAFSRMGIKFLFKDVPAKRASDYLARGLVDGDLGRIHSYGDRVPGLVRVEEHNHLVKFSAYSLDPGISLTGWQSLVNTDYIVDYRRGVAMCEKKLPKLIPANRLTQSTTIDQAMNKLYLGRSDIFVGAEDLVLKYLNQFNSGQKNPRVHHAGLMGSTTGHAWLLKKHAALAPKLSQVLRQMKQEGRFRQYRDEAGLTPVELSW